MVAHDPPMATQSGRTHHTDPASQLALYMHAPLLAVWLRFRCVRPASLLLLANRGLCLCTAPLLQKLPPCEARLPSGPMRGQL